MYRLLVIDDDSMMLKMLQRTLKSEGFEVFGRSTGEAGVQCALADKPDLVVLDVNLPDIEGHEVCRRLKEAPQAKHIPVIMLTGEARALDSRVLGLEVGAEAYLFKPISIPLLSARIKALLKITSKPNK